MNKENKSIPSGPENLPLKTYVKNLPLMVVVYDLKTEKEIRSEEIDYGNYDHRKWLGKITFFAASNGYSVETMALKDWKKFK